MTSKWNLGSSSKIVVSLEDFNENVGKCVEGFEGVHGENGVGKRIAKGRLLEFCDEKALCVANTWFYNEKRKITFSVGGCETKIDVVLVMKKYRKDVTDVKVISWELRHWLVVVDLNKRGSQT